MPSSDSEDLENGKLVTVKITVCTVETPMYLGHVSSNTDLFTLQNLSLWREIDEEQEWWVVEMGGRRDGVGSVIMRGKKERGGGEGGTQAHAEEQRRDERRKR